MTNHVHLLVTPATERGVGRFMKGLGFRYVQHVNRTDGRTGTLFEGRFRSSLTEGYAYRGLRAFASLSLARSDGPWS